jgi:hypothetical protein
MKKMYGIMVIGGFVMFGVMGCGGHSKAENSRMAIEQSQTMKTVEEQKKYLVSQANAFVKSQDYNEAINTAKYIISNLDKESREAKEIVEKATAELKKVAEQKAADLKNMIGQ